LGAVALQASCFTSLSVTGRWLQSGRSKRRIARQVTTALDEMGAPPEFVAGQASQASIGLAFALIVFSLPGITSTITRSGQAKYIEKTFAMKGPADGGLELRSIAGGLVAYFRGLNYKIEDLPQDSKLRFVGQMEGNFGQAAFLTMVLAGCLFSAALMCQFVFPDGFLALGPDAFFLPMLGSPYAGFYYMDNAKRKDIAELMLACADDQKETKLTVLGDKDTIEEMQAAVRFQSASGKLFRLMESDDEYQPGLFESNEGVQVFKEGRAA